MARELPKQYRPIEHEVGVWERWVAADAFHADPERVLRGEAEPYCILMPPPNVTDRLHLGHALNNTLQDVLTRAARMRGFETLWMPGTDHAGIATQAVVEKRLRASGELKGPLKEGMSREAFVAKAQAFKDEYEAVITGQLQKMGCSCDWARQRFTMDEVCARAVREAFFRLFRDGLIYRGKRLVNWDPVLQTAVADDECFDEEIDGAFYYLRYPVVRGSETARQRGSETGGQDAVPVSWGELARLGYPGAADSGADEPAWITVATTRPETYLGDTAVAVNPHDPRAKALRGLSVELPLVGRVIPVVEDSYVVLPEAMARTEEERMDPKAKFATGFLKVTPAHDPNDYEIGQRHRLASVNVMAPDASISDRHGWSDVGDAHIFVGLSREEARKKVVAEFKARGLLEGVKPHRHSVKHSDRSKAIIEPYLSDQWYVRVTDQRMAASANRALVEEQRASQSGSLSTQPSGAAVPAASPHPTSSPITAGQLQISYRRLPHWQLGGRTYFVTFRVASGILSPGERDIVLSACKHWDGERIELHAAVVMPDHVHLLFSPFEKSEGEWRSLSEILHSIKSFTAHEIMKARKASGQLWQDESFDRIVRDDEYREKLIYTVNNPIKAGLVATWREYRWTWAPPESLSGKLRFGDRWRSGVEGVGGSRDGCPTRCGSEDQSRAEAEAGDGSLRFWPSRYAKTYEQWHDNIRDWCISRQLWWGHRVPVWSAPIKINEIGDWQRTLEESLAQLCKEFGLVGSIATRFQSDGSSARIELVTHNEAAEQLIRAINVAVTISDETMDYWKRPSARDEVAGAFIDAGVPEATAPVTQERLLDIWRPLLAAPLSQDPDVLDTWFSSALWPLSTMGWPEATPLLGAFNPTSTLCTAREIITLWVSRMVMFNRYFRGAMGNGQWTMGKEKYSPVSGPLTIAHSPLPHSGPVPFRNVFIHCVIQDGQGQKMSKSLGNGVDPLDIIESHGADAMRFTLCHMSTQTQDVRMPVDLVCPHSGEVFPARMITNKDGYVVPAPIQESPRDKSKKMVTGYGIASGEAKATPEMPLAKNTSSKFDLGRNFANKLWNAARFALGILEGRETERPRDGETKGAEAASPRHSVSSSLALPDRWMLSRLAAAVKSCDEALANFEFSVYATTLYDLLWRDFCDWYLEAIKPTVAADPGQRVVLARVLDAVLRLLHPAMPFVTETIFESVRDIPGSVDGLTLVPPRKGGLLCTAGWPIAADSLRDEPAEMEFERLRGFVTAIREVRAKQNVPPKRRIVLHVPDGRLPDIRAHETLLSTLCQLERITEERPAGESAAFTFEALEYRLSGLADAVDAGAEFERLTKRITELDKTIDTIGKRLGNPSYVAKAPPKLVEESKAQLDKAMAEREAAVTALEKLKSPGR